jgi:hypothetical protein
MNPIDESVIQSFALAIAAGATLEELHAAAIEKGYSEEDFFLTYQVAKLLDKTIAEKEDEMIKNPLFGRKL